MTASASGSSGKLARLLGEAPKTDQAGIPLLVPSPTKTRARAKSAPGVGYAHTQSLYSASCNGGKTATPMGIGGGGRPGARRSGGPKVDLELPTISGSTNYAPGCPSTPVEALLQTPLNADSLLPSLFLDDDIPDIFTLCSTTSPPFPPRSRPSSPILQTAWLAYSQMKEKANPTWKTGEVIDAQRFPCRRIDRCTWSLLDEAVYKYVYGKTVMGKKRGGWKMRRITVNNSLDNEWDGGLRDASEPAVSLHSFKNSDTNAVETERLVLSGSSFAAVAESSKEYGGGTWVIKVGGQSMSEHEAGKGSSQHNKQRWCEWLLRFETIDRLQIWLSLLRSLIEALRQAEHAFRIGAKTPTSADLGFGATARARRSSDSRDTIQSDRFDLKADLSDSVEELISSTESLLLQRPRHYSSATPLQGLKGQSSRNDEGAAKELLVDADSKERTAKSHSTPSAKTDTTLRHSKSTPFVNTCAQKTVLSSGLPYTPPPPLTFDMQRARAAHISFPSPSASPQSVNSQRQGRDHQWDSWSDNSSAKAFTSSQASPTTSVSTSSPTPQSKSSQSPLLAHQLQQLQQRPKKMKKDPGLRLEVQSLRSTNPGVSHSLSSRSDSPTDPATTPSSHSDYSQDSIQLPILPRLSEPLDSPIRFPSLCMDDWDVGIAF